MGECLILDTETTGLDEPQPVEVAWLRVRGPRIIEAYVVLTS